jgi:hypothetical protein
MKGYWVLYIAAFFTVKSGIQLMGFDDGSGTMLVVVGVAMGIGAYLLGRRAKKTQTPPQA